jgi:hypothetical protein
MTFSLAGRYTYGCRAQLIIDGGHKGSEADGVYNCLVEAPDGVKLFLVFLSHHISIVALILGEHVASIAVSSWRSPASFAGLQDAVVELCARR